MMSVYRWFCSVGGIGYIGKGGGTLAALVCCLFCISVREHPVNPVTACLITLGIVAAGVWCAGKVEKGWGKDSARVVVDEVAGMCVSLLWIPLSISSVAAAFVLFRFFDIAKPLMIRKLESLPGGWGVMADDVLAGIYANIILQMINLMIK